MFKVYIRGGHPGDVGLPQQAINILKILGRKGYVDSRFFVIQLTKVVGQPFARKLFSHSVFNSIDKSRGYEQ